MAGDQVSHYALIGKLGAGGMGEVYVAEDTRLGRRVALKFLSEELARDPRLLERFHREARAASALSHPHICTIYDVGKHEGRSFIAMELLEGRTLAERIAGKPVPAEQLLEWALQIADALEAAHAAGIVHRDLKPANLFITQRSQAKVLDFGLAKQVARAQPAAADPTALTAGEPTLTREGVVVGTLGYTSPEQLRGGQADARSDLFAFGAVLYEMATGRRAFTGDTTAVVLDAILNRNPLPASRLNPELHPELAHIIGKALEKDPALRYQTAAELKGDLLRLKRDSDSALVVGYASRRPWWRKPLLWLSLATALVLVFVALALWLHFAGRGAPIQSVAVLPFANASGDAEVDYLSDGITDSLIHSVSQLPNLKVIAHASVFRYKGKEVDPRAVGRELGVGAILTGRVVQRGDQLSVSAELVDTRDNSHLWGEQYNRQMADIFAVQEEIAREIRDNLRLQFTPGRQRSARQPTTNVEAYRLYLRGRFFLLKGPFSPEWGNSRTYLEQAIAKDPGYAAPYAALAAFWAREAILGKQEGWERALAAARGALELDEDLAEAHAALALVALMRDWDWQASEREYRRALELNPNSPDVRLDYSFYLLYANRVDEAIAERRRALELDPLQARLGAHLGSALVMAGRYDEAILHLEKAVELDPSIGGQYFLAEAHAARGEYEKAAASQMRFLKSNRDPQTAENFERLYRAKGYASAVRYLDEDALMQEKEKPQPDPWVLAYLSARLGKKDEAFRWLEVSFQKRDTGLLQLRSDPDVASLRSDPRYADLVRRIGFPN